MAAEDEKKKKESWKYDSVFCIESDSEDEEVMYEQPKQRAKETTLLLKKQKEEEEDKEEMLLQGWKQQKQKEEEEEMGTVEILNQIDAALNEKKNIGSANR